MSFGVVISYYFLNIGYRQVIITGVADAFINKLSRATTTYLAYLKVKNGVTESVVLSKATIVVLKKIDNLVVES